MKYLLLGVCLCWSLLLAAQFGFTASYVDAQPDEWRIASTNQATSLPGDGWQVGVDYWFRLQAARIEFLPTLAISRRLREVQSTELVNARSQSVSFYLPINFYLLDLRGDCDCPTFSKQGPAIQKGLYLQISPGISWFDFQLSGEATELRDDDLNFNLGLALGLDIGVSDALTLSPFAGVRYYPGLEWSSLGTPAAAAFQFSESLQPAADVLEYQFGIRIGLNGR